MLYRRLCILFAYTICASSATSSSAAPFHSQFISDTFKRSEHSLLVRVHSSHKYSCRVRKRKCSKFRYHDDFKRCMQDYGCPPVTSYHSKRRSYDYHGHKSDYHRHTHGNSHGYKPNGYGHGYKDYHHKPNGYGYHKPSCRDAHNKCVARWNRDPYTRQDWYSDYFGCMEYYRCSPKYYPRARKPSYHRPSYKSYRYNQDWKW